MTNDNLKTVSEKILVCLGPGSPSAKIIKEARKTAADLKARWFVLLVETPEWLLLPDKSRQQVITDLRLAEQAGAESVTLSGRNGAKAIFDFAQKQKITRIFLGRPRGGITKVFSKGVVKALMRMGGDFDICLVGGDAQRPEGTPVYSRRLPKVQLSDYGTGILFFILATLLCFLMFPYFHLSNLIMVYLLGVMITAVSCGRGPAFLSSLLSVLGFDFFFVPPRYSFTVEEAQYIVTFIVMFLVALLISHLADRLRQQAALARYQERQANAMHGLSRRLAGTRGTVEVFQVAVEYLSEIFDGPIMALKKDPSGKLEVVAGDPSSVLHQDVMKEIQIAHESYERGQIIGAGMPPEPSTDNIYIPLYAADATFGLLAMKPADPNRFSHPEQLQLLESLSHQVALALEGEYLAGMKKSDRENP